MIPFLATVPLLVAPFEPALLQDDPTVEEALADLDVLASLILEEHAQPFRVNDLEVWEEAIGRAAAALEEGLDLVGVYAELQRLVCLAADGHSEIQASPALRHLMGSSTLPLRATWFEEGLFVVATPEQHGDLLGTRIVRIGGEEIEDVFRRTEPFVPADNTYSARVRSVQQHLLAVPFLDYLGLVGDDGRVELQVDPGDGELVDVTLEGVPQAGGHHGPADWLRLEPMGPTPLALTRTEDHYWFEYMEPERTVFFQFNAVRDTPVRSFASFCDMLFEFVDGHEVERLVIDLRRNGGGNNYLNQPLVHGLIRRPELTKPGSLFVLTSPVTFSAAMCLSGNIEANTHALFVGEPSGSGPNMAGDTELHTLPHTGFVARISALWWQMSDPRDTRSAIHPDLPVPARFADFVEGHDAALEAALSYVPEGSAADAGAPNLRWQRGNQWRER